MAAAFRSVAPGSITATTGYTVTLPTGIVAGDLLFHAAAWSGTITGLSFSGGWIEDTTSATTVNGTTLTFRKFYRIATADANDNLVTGWTTSRRATWITAAYSTVDYANLLWMRMAATGQVLTTSTTITTTFTPTLAAYSARKSLDIFVHGSAVLVTYGGFSGITTRQQVNQTSGPSVFLGDAFYNYPADADAITTIRSSTQSPTSISIGNHYAFRDELVSPAEAFSPSPLSSSIGANTPIVAVPTNRTSQSAGGAAVSDQAANLNPTAAGGAQTTNVLPPRTVLVAGEAGPIQNWDLARTPVVAGGAGGVGYADGVGGATIVENIIIEEQGI